MNCRFLRVRLSVWAACTAVAVGSWMLLSPIEFAVALAAALVGVASVRVAFHVADSIGRKISGAAHSM